MDHARPAADVESFMRLGLARLGIEADATELAIMARVEAAYRPQIDALMAADLSVVEVEADQDLAREPR